MSETSLVDQARELLERLSHFVTFSDIEIVSRRGVAETRLVLCGREQLKAFLEAIIPLLQAKQSTGTAYVQSLTAEAKQRRTLALAQMAAFYWGQPGRSIEDALKGAEYVMREAEKRCE